MVEQLLYVSESRIQGADAVIETEVTRILSTAYVNNSRRGVSGILLHADGYFVQLLEGPAAGVAVIWGVIQRDPRHHHCRVLLRRSVDTPVFQVYPMACAGVNARLRLEMLQCVDSQSELSDAEAGERLLGYLYARARGMDLELHGEQAQERRVPTGLLPEES